VNPNALRFRGLEYDALGENMVREHVRLAPEHGLPPVHVPPGRDGVVA
jgi:hypothetical protein